MKIVGISDVSIGYGSPEVPAFMDSVCRLFDAHGTIIEPDEIARPPIPVDPRLAFDVKRIPAMADGWSLLWKVDFSRAAVKVINEIQPDILILYGPAVIQFLFLLKRKPAKIIYFGHEIVSANSKSTIKAHWAAMDKIDLWTTPEINRTIFDIEAMDAQPKRIAPYLNCADVSYPDPVLRRPARERNGHFLFYGTLNRGAAFADYFWRPETKKYPLDIFGRITDADPAAVMEGLQSNPNCNYHGVLPGWKLNEERQKCSWSLVWWKPTTKVSYYLASNRFFSSIQAGVPPICGPHPQCVTFVERYDCGLIMKDWSYDSFLDVLEKASAIEKTSRYDELVSNCERAALQLNWPTQFKRMEPHLRAVARTG